MVCQRGAAAGRVSGRFRRALRRRAPAGPARGAALEDPVRFGAGGAEFRLPIDWLPRAEGMVRAGASTSAGFLCMQSLQNIVRAPNPRRGAAW